MDRTADSWNYIALIDCLFSGYNILKKQSEVVKPNKKNFSEGA